MRSVPSREHPSREEVLFRNVHAIKATTQVDSFSIRRPSQEEIEQIELDIGESVAELGLEAFVIESGKRTGYIVASEFVTAEDAGDYKTPSSILIGK